jgi:epoxide hydrolase 4
VRAAGDAARATGALPGMLNWYRALAGASEAVDAAKIIGLDRTQLRVRVPHLALLPVSRATLFDYCDHLTVCEIADADHWLVHQKTDEVIGLIGNFLSV